ncbi:Eco57I restriction-modification methylase domain-containing protein [Nocardiopsis baichengensis]|uniref:Eco57I restriction-modification methylase domain-containing protein n=1 Tax=Nocardiopsis baichengensis TaxID=280240 RepID=UPI00034DB5B5|nr:DNA methyltransferase [Nocardiopsis baichengensis]
MSAIARNQVFSAVHTVGGLLPADMLLRIAEGRDVPGAKPADYGVYGARSVGDEGERRWEYLKSVWKELRRTLPLAPGQDPPVDATGLAVTSWLGPLFEELGFGRIVRAPGAGITSDDGGKSFAVSHLWQHVPIHVAAWSHDLDKRPGGAGTVPPQSLVQEALNRSSAHLWAVVTNGRQLRLLRDSSALATAAYVEFDLEAIFDGELFSEFALLYRLVHASRFEEREDGGPSSCWLEKWRSEAISSGTRALDQLREGVQNAITLLGTGFLQHPANTRLREDVDARELHGALLRLVYRLLFLFVAEDRNVLHSPDATEQARERYRKYFSTARLRGHARRRRGTAHHDLYEGLTLVLNALGREEGLPALGLPGLGGLFDETDADAPLKGAKLSNEALLGAVRQLAQVRDPESRRWRAIDYRNLDAEELGSVYESLLELVPRHSPADRTFELASVAGNSRKTTGSYYTPSPLIDCLLDSSLDRVIDDAVKRGEKKAAAAGRPDPADTIVDELLGLKVCDPACGSGHFLVAAARRIAKRVAAVREHNPEPTVDAVRRAVHEVVSHCIYAVDLNPMAVELAKVSLWLEAMEPGKPLDFLDAHIKHGNALAGVTPVLLRDGVPDEAFKPIEGDDRKHARFLEKTNEKERGGQGSLFDLDESVKVANTRFASGLRRITDGSADSLQAVRRKASAFERWQSEEEYARAVRVADAWCAAFVWWKTPDAPPPVTHGVLRALEDPEGAGASAETHAEIDRLREQYRFFHWHLEFPDVFTVPEDGAGVNPETGWAGGFDCVLGNPPWERVKLQEQEFFAQRDEAIANAKNAAKRGEMIAALADSDEEADRELYEEFGRAKRNSEGVSWLLRGSGRYPLTGRGDVNTYSVFAETAATIVSGGGSFGLVLPTGIATDATTAPFFSSLLSSGRLASFFDFGNEASLLSRDVHKSFRFCLLSATGRESRVDTAQFAFGVRHMEDLPGRRFTMPPEEIALVNPNTGTLPVFETRRDAEISLNIHKKFPVLVDANRGENPWGFSYVEVLHLSHAAEDLVEECKDGYYPVFEAKMAHHFDHRWSSRGGHNEVNRTSPKSEAVPRYWVPAEVVDNRLKGRWDRSWMLGWRDICRATDERTVIPAIVPRSALANTFPLALIESPSRAPLLVAILSSFVLDYIARQKIVGTHLTMNYMRQLPVVPPEIVSQCESFVVSRVAELTYTSWSLEGFARDIGMEGSPFIWNNERRMVMRSELDAFMLHLYGVSRSDAEYILQSFSLVKQKDEAKYGVYRTMELILRIYDRMAESGISVQCPPVDGENFISELTPPPGQGLRHEAR